MLVSDAATCVSIPRATPVAEGPGLFSSYEDMMSQATRAAERGFGYMECGNSARLCDSLRVHQMEFWRRFCIVAGFRLPEDMTNKGHFCCGC